MELETAKHGLVTGGASGIGLGLVEAMAARGINVTVVDANRDTLGALQAKGSASLRGVYHDVRDRDGWARVKAEAEAAFGPVDILVNNAGIAPSGDAIADMDPAHFDQIVAINLTGVFNGVSAFAADMRARGRGHIVNTASMAGLCIMPTTAAYVAAKFGVVGFSETLRQELAPHGVGVSTFCPGRVVTSLIANTMKLGGHTKFPAGGGTGSDPADIGLLILEGIAQNARFILSEPDYWRTLVEDHLQAVREAFDKGGLA